MQSKGRVTGMVGANPIDIPNCFQLWNPKMEHHFHWVAGTSQPGYLQKARNES
jgi:hypothetical protein